MKRTLAIPVTLSILALTGCATLPASSGSLHPDVLTQDISPSFSGGTVIFDKTASGEQNFTVNHELTADEAVSVTLVCPTENQALDFSAKSGNEELWSGSTTSCGSNFSDKTTFTPGAQDDVNSWNLSIAADDSVEYRIIICVEDL